MPRSSPEVLSAELERLTVRAIRATFSDLNAGLFRSRLRRPVLELVDTRRLGAWMRADRRLELSRGLLLERGWGALVEVLKHEMAHQYVDEVLGCTEETAHGATFRQVCAERGIDARAAGAPLDRGARAPVLERVAKLLALAESSNEHEAQAAMNAAQRLILKYNLDAVSKGEDRGYSYRHLGRATGRVSESERILANILSNHFFVDCIWVPVWRPMEGKRGSVLEICGTLENLELAEYVHSFLVQTADRLWREHKKRERILRNRDRRAYLAGVMAGFRDQLRSQADASAREGLVWVGDGDLDGYFKARHPSVRWTRHASSRGSEAHEHGRAAGRRIVLHRGVRSGPSGGPKLLGQ